ncbi:hypothetical protein DES40_1048 [Litorimonas taeanensis]|uniref:Cell division protein FtsL n=1 Tax=Litorimonas taeanensis TaxID=568099 RepID=A0A420WL53_9PROT|nr:hypothetical protein [Litorimonas taeanensis]RKQ71720.1 hypothetical protein DES40_1048 [Litorimonas taeanensis]
MSAYAHDPSASKRLSAFVLFVIGVSLTIALFYVKTRAQTAHKNVVKIERAIEKEKAAIAVLEAEIAYSQSPERLAALSKAQLGTAPIKASNTITLDQIAERFPLREGASDE